MMTLFDETKNPLFRLMCRLVNEIHAGARLTRKDILKRVTSMPEFNYLEAPEIDREREIIEALFDFAPDGIARLRFDAPIDHLISSTELSWLKTMLLEEELAFLMPPDVRARLLERLKNIEPLYESGVWKKIRPQKKTPRGEKFFAPLSTIVEALRDRKKLRSDEKIFIPCRLEYDLFTDRYAVINWLEAESRAEKIPVEALVKLALIDESIPADIEERLQDFYRRHRAELRLRLSDTRNAVERCFAVFGAYDKAARLQEDGSYFLTIEYCDLDEDEIFDKIISLGAAVVVLEPEHFRRRVIERLRAIAKLYND